MAAIPPLQWSIGGMVFDAWLRLNHNTSLTITQHPVETGAAITDHAYNNPRRFSFNLGQSDVSTIETSLSTTPAINKYQELVALQQSREPLQLVSKYGIFTNVLIESVDVADDYTTNTVLKATVNLQEIIIANTGLAQAVALPQTILQTQNGQKQAQNPLQKILEAGIRLALPSFLRGL